MENAEWDIVVGVQAVETLRYDTFERGKVHTKLSCLDFDRSQDEGGVASIGLLIKEHFLQSVFLSATNCQYFTDLAVFGHIL